MGSTKEEMKPCTKKDTVKTVNAADMVGKTGGVLSRIRESLKKTAPQRVAKNYADYYEDFADLLEAAIKKLNFVDFVTDTKLLMNQIDLRLQDMIVGKRKELKSEGGREEYNQRAIARLQAMDWHWQSVLLILQRQPKANETPLMMLEYIDFHKEEIGRLIVEYTDDN